MDGRCVVFGCRNSSIPFQMAKNECNLFPFPLNQQDLLDRWLEKLYLQGWKPGPENLLCEEHFSPDSFEIRNNTKVLKRDAVPNLIEEWDRAILNNAETWHREPGSNEDDAVKESRDLRCRICAAYLSSRNAIYIFSEDENVIDKMMACIPISIKNDDTLPKYICRVCLLDLNTSYQLLLRAIESEKFFNSFMQDFEERSRHREIIESNAEKLMIVDLEPRAVCGICDLSFEDFVHLSVHLEEQHVDELIFDNLTTEKETLTENESEKINPSRLQNVADNFTEDYVELKENSDLKYNFEKDSFQNKYDHNDDIGYTQFSSTQILKSHLQNFHKLPKNFTGDDVSGTIDNGGCSTDVEVNMPCYRCQQCNLILHSINELKDHNLIHVDSLICDVCGFAYCDQEEMLRHEKSHSELSYESYVCSTCSTVFPTCDEMVNHSRVHQAKNTKNDVGQQKWLCRYCGKELGTKLSLTIHERVHTGVRPFGCEFCGRKFKCKANLIQHQPVHTGIKRHKCSICGKAFARKAFVDTHMRVHTGERPFKCDICGNRYTQIGDMRRHRRRHATKAMQDSNEIVYDILQSEKAEFSRDLKCTRKNEIIPVNNLKDNVLKSSSEGQCAQESAVVTAENSISFEHILNDQNFKPINVHFMNNLVDIRRILVE